MHTLSFLYLIVVSSYNNLSITAFVVIDIPLVPGWMTIFAQINHLSAEPGTQAYSA